MKRVLRSEQFRNTADECETLPGQEGRRGVLASRLKSSAAVSFPAAFADGTSFEASVPRKRVPSPPLTLRRKWRRVRARRQVSSTSESWRVLGSDITDYLVKAASRLMRTLATAVMAVNSRDLPCIVAATGCKVGAATVFLKSACSAPDSRSVGSRDKTNLAPYKIRASMVCR